jgi:glycosyltransferase involved in cell wall biosynthesis
VRICIIGKFPPIQGGVSMRTYRTAHALAARGHDVHVVTNAKEVTPPFRMHMRTEDWARCEARLDSGSVTVHWTDPVDRSQSFIPMASPFVSKLASIATRAHAEQAFDIILSHYLEPYGVAGFLASQMTGAPHVVRMAGSDAGRLWHHPQLEPLYDHVLRSAEAVAAVGPVAERAAKRGVERARIAPGGGISLPDDTFTPDGPIMDFEAVRNEVEQDGTLRDLLWGDFEGNKSYFGIYGKLGDNKGSFALLAAMHRLKAEGLEFGLVALAHGRADVEARFRKRVNELGLTDRVLQIPYLPHWRVPEFLRGCLAVCCLEQDFPISVHSPIVPMEVLLCGSCLVASTEVIRKLPQWDRLPHGYGCVAVNDVNDVNELSGKLAAIVRKPNLAAVVGARGHAFARDCQQAAEFPERLEQILQAAAQRQTPPSPSVPATAEPTAMGEFALTRMAIAALRNVGEGPGFDVDGASNITDPSSARKVLAKLRKTIATGRTNLLPFAQAVEVEIAVAQAKTDQSANGPPHVDPLFRINMNEWALADGKLGSLTPVRNGRCRILRFECDISELLSVQSVSEFPSALGPGPSHIVVFGDPCKEPAVVDPFTARILELSDGTRTGSEIANQLAQEFGRTKSADQLAWIENLLLLGALGLTESPIRL